MKVSIVTPSFNSSRFIRDTVLSVITQAGNFSIEYLVMDNCSTDGTPEIVEEIRRALDGGALPVACNGVEIILVSEKDQGMYDAINKGFERATGEICAWLNADDVYLPGALATIVRVLQACPDVHWVKGITSYMTSDGSIWRAGNCLVYSQDWIKAGIYGRDHYFIQQDSVFWRAWLWKKCGGVRAELRRAGDYDLWTRFAQHAPLITIRAWTSCFRTVDGQLSQDVEAYRREVEGLARGDASLRRRVSLFHRYERYLPAFVRPLLFELLFGRHEYAAIRIGANGQLDRCSGGYYEVLDKLSGQSG